MKKKGNWKTFAIVLAILTIAFCWLVKDQLAEIFINFIQSHTTTNFWQ